MHADCLAAAPFFVDDYHVCRQHFLSLVAEAGKKPVADLAWQVPVQESAEPLVCDAIFLGEKNARKVLVLISGTHGVEGFCGSAVQRFLLQQIIAGFVLPADTAVVMVHALNPWGMLWARRCDQDGIDLNRNFLDFSSLPEPHPDYQELYSCLEITDVAQRRQRLQQLTERWGQRHFDEVYSGGQGEYPWAPFYSGTGPSFSNGIIDELIDSWQLSERELVVLDLHSGLGPWGYGELISDHPANSPGNTYARKLFGPAVAVTDNNESFSVPKRGLLDYRWHTHMESGGCFLKFEFGTFSTERLFHVLLEEHGYWREQKTSPAYSDPFYQQSRQKMLNHFFPKDVLWQQAVLFRAWQLFVHVVRKFSE